MLVSFPLAFFIRVVTRHHMSASEALPLVLTSPARKDYSLHLQMRKRRLRGFMWLAQGHTAKK